MVTNAHSCDDASLRHIFSRGIFECSRETCVPAPTGCDGGGMETEVLAETESVPPNVQDAELPPVALEESAEVEQLDCRFCARQPV